ncbi:hypothetical protein [Neolewinella litorea]|uniref:Uncharacterized protein n=1 Tax=Neolewinella litorea TaxID=2562452 RepID=A0A4S4N5Z7_9BACT|nr:hypothetical protein [Neolewinella litorea]THH34526.1 hypothetical protein E4021_17660 [Neolewinella litorea]
MIDAKDIAKDYLKRDIKEEPSLVLLSRRKAEAFCEEYNLTPEEEVRFFELIAAFEQVGTESPFPLASIDSDYRKAKAIDRSGAAGVLYDYVGKLSREEILASCNEERLVAYFIELEERKQAILIAALYLQEGLLSWEQVYTTDHAHLSGLRTDSIDFSHMFVAIAELVKGGPIKTSEELLDLTGYDRYLEEEPSLKELVDCGGLFHTAGLYRYREELKRKMRRGATYKQLLAVKPSSFFLPNDLSKVDSLYNGQYYDEDKGGMATSSVFAYKSKEEIVAALIDTHLISGPMNQKTNNGYLVELYSTGLEIPFQELLEISLNNNKI